MSIVINALPMVWAVEEIFSERPEVDLSYYRRYTEALLRRYLRMSLEAGRAPSLLGREMFRGNVTNYRVHSFEDVVIFVHDVENCLEKLDAEQRYFIDRMTLQEYTQDETVELSGLPRTSLLRRYEEALDKLTKVLLQKGLLEKQHKSCQDEKICTLATTATIC